MTDNRYERNSATLTKEETARLHDCHVAVVGCGGLGGYIIEMLGRIGVGHIRAIDGDKFEVSNLNRQLLCTEENIGKSKAKAAGERMAHVNSRVAVESINFMLTEDNAASMLAGMDLVIDALDSLSARLMLQEAAKKENIPLIHGAIGGWYGRVTTVYPGDDTLSRIYAKKKTGVEKRLGNLSVTSGIIASVEASEAVKVLLNKGTTLRNKYVYIDLQNNLFQIMDV